LQYAEALDESDRKKLAALLRVMGDIGQVRNKEKFRYEGDKITPSSRSPIASWPSFSRAARSSSPMPSPRRAKSCRRAKKTGRRGA
jgi:hypothetical protein